MDESLTPAERKARDRAVLDAVNRAEAALREIPTERLRHGAASSAAMLVGAARFDLELIRRRIAFDSNKDKGRRK